MYQLLQIQKSISKVCDFSFDVILNYVTLLVPGQMLMLFGGSWHGKVWEPMAYLA